MMQKGWDWSNYVPTAQFHIIPPVSLWSHGDPCAPAFRFPMLFRASKETINQIHSGNVITQSSHSAELVQEIVFTSIGREKETMDTYDTLFVGGSRCGQRDILKIHSFYSTWIYMNGYSSIFLLSEGRKILRQAWSSGRCLADSPPNALQASRQQGLCPPHPWALSSQHRSGLPHIAVLSVSQGVKDINVH